MGIVERMLDISVHQGGFDASKAAAQGISTVICRCAYGTGKDRKLDEYVTSIRAAGLNLYFYGFLTAHYQPDFATAQSVGTAQINYWLSLCNEKGVKVLCIDQELEPGHSMFLTKEENTRLLQNLAAQIRSAGLTPLVYASASWLRDRLDWNALGCDIWAAYYDGSAPFVDSTLPAGTWGYFLQEVEKAGKLFAWQFSSSGDGSTYGAGSARIDCNWKYKNYESEESGMTYTIKVGSASTGDLKMLMNYADTYGLEADNSGGYVTFYNIHESQKAGILATCNSLLLPYHITAETTDTDLAELKKLVEQVNETCTAMQASLDELRQRIEQAGFALRGGQL